MEFDSSSVRVMESHLYFNKCYEGVSHDGVFFIDKGFHYNFWVIAKWREQNEEPECFMSPKY